MGIPTSLVVFGGYDYGYTYYNDTHLLENGNLKWSTVSPTHLAPDSRASFVGTAYPVTPYIVIFGGRSNDGFTVYDDAWVFDGSPKTWSLIEA